ncbi:MAG TPA: VanZ family protein [Gemmatimonadales bacterium]|nr:VanZ family protein [Gemmatimonadales bacterium]
MHPTSRQTGRRLGLLLLGYLAALVAVVVLAPFRFAWPTASRFVVVAGEAWWLDAILNVVLFVPLGFVGARAVDRRGVRWVVVVGLLVFSATLETLQLLLPGRYSTWSDIVANTTGALVGVALARLVARRVGDDRVLVPNLLLDLPLTGLLWLLVPALWLDGLGAAGNPARLRLLLPVAVAGGLAAAAVATSAAGERRRGAEGAVGLVILWYGIGVVPAVFVDPTVAALGFAVAMAAAFAGVPAWREALRRERRLEPHVLRFLLPLLVAYLIGLAAYPGALEVLGPEGGRVAVLRWIERVAAFTVLGYAVAEWGGRREAPIGETVLPGVLVAALLASGLQGFGDPPAGWSSVPLFACAAAVGGVLYHLQRAHVIALRRGE